MREIITNFLGLMKVFLLFSDKKKEVIYENSMD